MSEIMPRLKAETRSEHTATEETDLARSMLLSTMTRSEYEAQLVSYLTVLTALERAAGASLRVSQVLGTTSKAARIRADLSALEKVCHRPISASPTTAAQEFAERILAAFGKGSDPSRPFPCDRANALAATGGDRPLTRADRVALEETWQRARAENAAPDPKYEEAYALTLRLLDQLIERARQR